MSPIWLEILILLNIPSGEMLQPINDCKSSGMFDFFILLLSGGVVTSLLQIVSDAVGNKRIKEAYKKSQEKILILEEDAKHLYERKEKYKDVIQIIQAKVEMFDKQNLSECKCLLSTEITKTISQVMPVETTDIPGLD